jgi:hypothetical protein
MNDAPWYVSMIVAWLPFILLWLGFVYIGRQFRRGVVTKDGRALADVIAELSAEMKRRNDGSNPK